MYISSYQIKHKQLYIGLAATEKALSFTILEHTQVL